MDEVLELWPADARDVRLPKKQRSNWVFRERTQFWIKTALLAVTTLAVVPILAWQHESAAALYLGFLVFVHIAGLAVFAWGVKRSQIAPTPRGFIVRLGGLVALIGLLAWVAKGLGTGLGSWVFWASLFGIWATHTVGLLFLHIRSPGEAAACPFV